MTLMWKGYRDINMQLGILEGYDRKKKNSTKF